MANDVKFEGKERRMPQIEACLAEYGIASLEDAQALCKEKGIDVEGIVKGVQPIAFDNAVWAYTLGVAVALKKGIKNASDAAAAIGIGLQAFCIPGSVAEQESTASHMLRPIMISTRASFMFLRQKLTQRVRELRFAATAQTTFSKALLS